MMSVNQSIGRRRYTAHMVSTMLCLVLTIQTLLAVVGCNKSQPYVRSWGRTFGDFTADLAAYHAVYKKHLYDERGAEYALYRLVKLDGYLYGKGEDMGNVEQLYSERHALPFSRDDKNGKVVNSQVYYLNPPPNTLRLDDEPVVLLIRRFDATDWPSTVAKRPLLKSHEALFISSNFKWYWGTIPKSKIAKEEDLLGKKVKDILAMCNQSETHNMRDSVKNMFVRLWKETAKNSGTSSTNPK